MISEDPAASRPYYRLLGLRVEIGMPAGYSTIRLDSRAELENSRGDVHGGVVALHARRSYGPSCAFATSYGQGVATASLTVNYLEPANPPLLAKGRVMRLGRTIRDQMLRSIKKRL
jgi:uncharacterized protein (TIGR00369 family)